MIIMKKTHFISVRGKKHEWAFDVEIDPKHVSALREDGIDVYELRGLVPMWVANARLTRLWLFFQDCFNFRNPFSNA